MVGWTFVGTGAGRRSQVVLPCRAVPEVGVGSTPGVVLQCCSSGGVWLTATGCKTGDGDVRGKPGRGALLLGGEVNTPVAACLGATALTTMAGVVLGEIVCWLLPLSLLSPRLLDCKGASGSWIASPVLGSLTLTGCDDNREGVRTGGGDWRGVVAVAGAGGAAGLAVTVTAREGDSLLLTDLPLSSAFGRSAALGVTLGVGVTFPAGAESRRPVGLACGTGDTSSLAMTCEPGDWPPNDIASQEPLPVPVAPLPGV